MKLWTNEYCGETVHEVERRRPDGSSETLGLFPTRDEAMDFARPFCGSADEIIIGEYVWSASEDNPEGSYFCWSSFTYTVAC